MKRGKGSFALAALMASIGMKGAGGGGLTRSIRKARPRKVNRDQECARRRLQIEGGYLGSENRGIVLLAEERGNDE